MADVTGNAQPIEGAAAHDAPASENPVLTAFRANKLDPAVVADGDVVTAWGDTQGRLVVVQNSPQLAQPNTVTLTDTTETILRAAPGGGNSIHVVLLTATNTSGTGVRLDIKDGTTVKFSFFLAASGGGFVLPLPGIGWKLAGDTSSLRVQLSAAVTDVRVTAICYDSEAVV